MRACVEKVGVLGWTKSKTFCRSFDDIENFYIKLYRSDVRNKFDVGEHMGVLSSIQLCSANFDSICKNCFVLLPNQ